MMRRRCARGVAATGRCGRDERHGRGTIWRRPDRVPPLVPGEVHVWRVDLAPEADSAEADAALLAPDEVRRAGRFHFPRDRRRFIAGRAALRRLLGQYLRRRPASLAFRYGEHGKPALAEGVAPAFNLAHSDDWALIACAESPALGVDLEAIRPIADLHGLARQCLAPAELAAWLALPAAARLAAFYRCWARKESYLKACEIGLGAPLTAIDVGFAPYPAPRPLGALGLPDPDDRYASVDLAAAPGYAAALTVAGGPGWRVATLAFPPAAWAGGASTGR